MGKMSHSFIFHLLLMLGSCGALADQSPITLYRISLLPHQAWICDVRLLFAEMEGKVVCVKFGYGGEKASRVFQSPVGKVEVSTIGVEDSVAAWFVNGAGVCTVSG